MRNIVPRLRVAAFETAPPDTASHVERWDTNDGHAIEGYRTADGVGWIAVSRIAAYRFAAEGPVEAASLGGDDAAVEDTWLRSVLPLVVQARGTQVLHASAVRGPAGVLALCGISTAGKSTVAAVLRSRGHSVVADDALGFEVESEKVMALPLPFRLRLRPASVEALGLPALAHVADEPAAAAPLVAVVLLEPADAGPVTLKAIAASEAVGALMPHLYCFALEEGKERLVESALGLACAASVHRLAFVRSFGQLAAQVECVEALMAEPRGG